MLDCVKNNPLEWNMWFNDILDNDQKASIQNSCKELQNNN